LASLRPPGSLCGAGSPGGPSGAGSGRFSQHHYKHWPERPVLLAFDQELGADAALRVLQNSPIRLARSKSGGIRTWSSSARGAGPSASRRSCSRRPSLLGRTGRRLRRRTVAGAYLLDATWGSHPTEAQFEPFLPCPFRPKMSVDWETAICPCPPTAPEGRSPDLPARVSKKYVAVNGIKGSVDGNVFGSAHDRKPIGVSARGRSGELERAAQAYS
jgi:hypothetical protein